MRDYTNSLFVQSGIIEKIASPDVYDLTPPSDNFVLCRDKNGEPTAVYEWNVWDLNPYRLSKKRLNKIHFSRLFSVDNVDTQGLVAEVKWILFCLIHCVSSGRVGRLSATTVLNYFDIIRRAARFCYAQKENELVGVISLQTLLTTPVYLAAFIRSGDDGLVYTKTLPSWLKHCASIGEEQMGYRVCSRDELTFKKKGSS